MAPLEKLPSGNRYLLAETFRKWYGWTIFVSMEYASLYCVGCLCTRDDWMSPKSFVKFFSKLFSSIFCQFFQILLEEVLYLSQGDARHSSVQQWRNLIVICDVFTPTFTRIHSYVYSHSLVILRCFTLLSCGGLVGIFA